MDEFIIEHPFDRLTIRNHNTESQFLEIQVDVYTGDRILYFDLELETAKELVQYLTDKINKAKNE